MLDDEQTAQDVAFVDAHLAECQECRTALDRMAALTRWMRVAPVDSGPRDSPARGPVLPPRSPEPAPPPSTCPSGLRLVGVAACGCAASCACGCQEGQACGCASHAA